MALLITITDFKTHLYEEIIDVITREDDTIVDLTIVDAISEAKGYLSKFDTLKLFGSAAVDPTIVDSFLKRIVKDIAAWHLVRLANPNVNLELYRTAYEDALKWLTNVQKGLIDPEGWEYKADDPDTEFNESSNIQASSNDKQNHHF